MARRQSWSVGELIVEQGGGIIAGQNQRSAKVMRGYRVAPAAKVADHYFASAAMHNGVYTLANPSPGDGLAHNVTCAQTAVDVEDTNGTLVVVGTNILGHRITETITPNAGVTVQGNLAFATITSITGVSWAQGGTGPDTIVIGFGDKVGLPECLAAAGDLIAAFFDTAWVASPTLAVDSDEVEKNTITVVGDGSKVLALIYQV